MDPEVAVRRIRGILFDCKRHDYRADGEFLRLLMEEIDIEFRALDDWMKGGGALPSSWTP